MELSCPPRAAAAAAVGSSRAEARHAVGWRAWARQRPTGPSYPNWAEAAATGWNRAGERHVGGSRGWAWVWQEPTEPSYPV